MNKKAHTLLEIIVTVVILSLVMGGLVATFVSGKKWLAHSRFRITGGEIGRDFLDPLTLAVRQDQWDDDIGADGDYESSNFLSKSSQRTGTTITLNNKVYTPTYDVEVIPTLTDDKYKQARKAKVTINWNE